MDINDLLQGALKDQLLKNTTQQLGANNQQADIAINATIATLMNAVSKNMSSPQGAQNLMSAINKDHDGSILDNLGGFLSGQMNQSNPRATNGAGIINHLIGGQKESIVKSIAQQSGMNEQNISMVMNTLAPVVLGMIGKVNSQAKQNQPASQANNGGELLDFIQGATNTANKQPAAQGILGQLFDKNGDGNIVDDLAKMGVKSLFSKFGKK